jgi:D-serine dehydratase
MKGIKMTIAIDQLTQQYPLIKKLISLQETSWFNPAITSFEDGLPHVGLDQSDIKDASDRLKRFAPYLAHVFPGTQKSNGIIESDVVSIPAMKATLDSEYATHIAGQLMLKKDSHLPISGSIKARGGIYEVLVLAEKLAIDAGMLNEGDDYTLLATEPFKAFFSQFSIAVGSTGNLGLSIGIMSAKLGFSVSVHMSADAKAWKKDKLRSHGVTVVEYEQDYGVAVAQVTQRSRERSELLFH